MKRTTNPVYPAKDATFNFPIYLSLADKLGVVELVVWDKDMLKKEYLGEVGLPLEDWFKNGIYAFDDPDNEVRCFVVKSHPPYNASRPVSSGECIEWNRGRDAMHNDTICCIPQHIWTCIMVYTKPKSVLSGLHFLNALSISVFSELFD